MIRKKGEMTTQQIVLMIVLITSFIIILFLLFRLNLGGESDEELCHNSVLTRASKISTSSAPLNCQRSYVCITEDGTCEGLVNAEEHKVNSLMEVYEVLADEMADCWWMFGEGKVDYIGSSASNRNYCSICSQVVFDDSLKSLPEISNGIISKDGLYTYLSEHNLTGKDFSYADYIFGTSDIEGLKKEIAESPENPEGIATFGSLLVADEGNPQYYVVMGITSEIGAFYKILGGVIAVAALVTPIGWVATAVIIGVGTGAAIGGDEIADYFRPEIGAIVVQGDGIKNEFMAPTIQEANSEKFEQLNCAKLESA